MRDFIEEIDGMDIDEVVAFIRTLKNENDLRGFCLDVFGFIPNHMDTSLKDTIEFVVDEFIIRCGYLYPRI